MPYEIMRSGNQIDNLRAWATGRQDDGSHYPDLSYEDGIEHTLAWLLGERDDNPTGEMI